MNGSLALVLHAHLPYVRHPEHDRFLEEDWLHEAVAECYLPLLRRMSAWEADGVDWHLTLGITPTLGAMLDDPLLRSRTWRYLRERITLAESECTRTIFEPARRQVAEFHREFYQGVHSLWEALGGDLVEGFRAMSQSGRLELLGGAATHAVLPLLLEQPASLRAQVELGCQAHERRFGVRPTGFWLPECAWSPALEPVLHEAGVRRVVLETQALTRARPTPPAAVFTPVVTPSGLVAFGRDPASARQVWSRHGGYPGDPRYREFHRDLAHEAEWESVRAFLPDAGVRAFTGIKYHRVTGKSADKELYVRREALKAVSEHAAHFLGTCRERCERIGARMGRPPLVVAPYDAELFGHWWFEGPDFLDVLMRTAAGQGVETVTLSGYLAATPIQPSALPAESSWGDGGHLGVWLDPSNASLQPRLRRAGADMERVARVVASEAVSPVVWRAAVQCARELLLAQSSDWPFLIRMRTAEDYARSRVEEHLRTFQALADGILGRGGIDGERLRAAESKNPLDSGVDPRLWIPPGD